VKPLSPKVDWEQKIVPALRQSGLVSANCNCRVILELAGNGTSEIQEIIQENKGKLCKKTNVVSTLIAEVPFSAIQALAKSKQVKRIWQDNPIRILNEDE
jgi:nitrogenase subunit NifH